MRLGLIVLAAMLAIACNTHRAGCPTRLLAYQTGYDAHYDVRPSMRTPDGIALDTSGVHVNPARVDRLVREVETCLSSAFGVPPKIPDAVAAASGCPMRTFPLPLLRSCIVVKIAPDWRWSADHAYQTLPIVALGVHECKGHADTCYYRTLVQEPEPFTLVTTPSMYLLKDWIVRVSTGCANPWAHPTLAACTAPTTGPLDDGSGP